MASASRLASARRFDFGISVERARIPLSRLRSQGRHDAAESRTPDRGATTGSVGAGRVWPRRSRAAQEWRPRPWSDPRTRTRLRSRGCLARVRVRDDPLPARVRWCARHASAAPRPADARRRPGPGSCESPATPSSAERNDSLRTPRSSSSGSTVRLPKVVASINSETFMRDHQAIDERLNRQVSLAERSQVAKPQKHGQTVSGDKHVHHHDRQAPRSPPSAATVRSGDPRPPPLQPPRSRTPGSQHEWAFTGQARPRSKQSSKPPPRLRA